MEQGAAILQFVGTLVTLGGLIVVAPRAAGRMLPDVWGWTAKRLPFLRKSVILRVGGTVSAAVALSGSVYGRVGTSDAGTTEQQLAALRSAIESIHGELDGLRSDLRGLRTEVAERFARVSQEYAELKAQMEQHAKGQEQLNSRGFPLAAVGALLAGVPGVWLAGSGWWLLGPLLVVGVAAAAVAGRWLWDSRAEIRQGWTGHPA